MDVCINSLLIEYCLNPVFYMTSRIILSDKKYELFFFCINIVLKIVRTYF